MYVFDLLLNKFLSFGALVQFLTFSLFVPMSWHGTYDVFQFSTFGSILNVGCMFGAIISGRLADYFGRKRVSADDTDDAYLQNLSLKWLIKDKSYVAYVL